MKHAQTTKSQIHDTKTFNPVEFDKISSRFVRSDDDKCYVTFKGGLAGRMVDSPDALHLAVDWHLAALN